MMKIFGRIKQAISGSGGSAGPAVSGGSAGVPLGIDALEASEHEEFPPEEDATDQQEESWDENE